MVVVIIIFICPINKSTEPSHLFCPMTEHQQQPIWKDKESIRGQTRREGGWERNCCHVVRTVHWSHPLEKQFFGEIRRVKIYLDKKNIK